MMRAIIHVDMNAFFASCHQAENPAWRGKPLLVAGDPKKRHGIILTASYEARQCGIKTAMTVWQAKKLCPQGIFIPPDHHLYLAYSEKILTIFRSYTPLVEPFSIDEAWLDVTGSERLFGSPEEIGQQLQQRILAELEISCSVGIAPNKFLAKMASERQKPRGFTIIGPQDIRTVLWPLPVEKMVGVGRKIAPALKEMGVETIGQLAKMPERLLVSRFGVMGEILRGLANGDDDSPVDPQALDTAKSIGHSITLPRDINDPEDVARILLELSERVGRRLRQGGYSGRTITLTVKDQNFVTITRASTLQTPAYLTETIYQTAQEIYHSRFEPWRKVRLLGIAISNLQARGEGLQLTLWDQTGERLTSLTETADKIKDRFGDYALQRASLYKNKD
ncbi:MAG TPA: DNA polymerase IV [Oscillospiraceae bacterium]|nr:DNA polymerase IV [Oscillospiraceae bacterium]